jgi:cold shock CspA family protein
MHLGGAVPVKKKKLQYIQGDSPRIEGKYYKGRIARFNPVTGYGFVESHKGTHIFFYVDQIRLEGKHSHKSCVRQGRTVGFDVGWTEKGIRVNKMKIFQNDRQEKS